MADNRDDLVTIDIDVETRQPAPYSIEVDTSAPSVAEVAPASVIRKRREDKYWEAQWHIDALYHELQRGVERKPGGDYYGAYG